MKDLSRVLFITDMDGTLLPADKRLNKADLAAIRRFRELGGHFSVATGRSLQSAAQYFEALELDEPVILCNGGGIYDCARKRFMWQKFVDASAYDTVMAVFESFPSVAGEITMSDAILVPRLNAMEEYHIRISYGGEYTFMPLEDIPREGWCKMLFAAEKEDLPALREYIAENGNGKVDFVQSSPIFYEILPKGCLKGDALRKLTEIYRMDGWITAACGDYDNDLKMLEYADYGFAPSNAQECVKKAACYVTAADCNGGAVAEALEYIINTL